MDTKSPKIPEIDFNPDLFNNVFWHLKEAFDNILIRFIWVFGGSSASKTFSVVQLQVIKMLEGPDENALVLRKYATDIRDSIYMDFKNVIHEWGLDDLFIIQQNFIKCKTGSYVRFRGLDDSEKVKGISNFKRVILEEISQFDEVDLKQIRKRLRGKSGQQIIGIFNPISEEHWIKVNVFDKEELVEVKTDISGKWLNKSGNTVILKTNYLDNVYIVGRWAVNAKGELVQIGGFIDQHAIDDFEKDKIEDFAYYQVYGLGNWGKLRTGGEFWKDFNPNIHIKANPSTKNIPLLFNPNLPIHMGWDKNVHPYQPCALWQHELIKGPDGKTIVRKNIWQFDEFAYEDPRNRVRIVCQDFIAKYPPSIVKGLFIYGDRTAISEDSTKEKGENMFTEILSYLKDYKPTLRLQTSNPSVFQSGKFVNACYKYNEGGIYIWIGDNCKKSVYDYQYALEDSEGGISKKTKKNPLTGVTYQEFGHFSDIKRYIITVALANEYSKYLSGGRANKITVGKNIHKNAY